MNLVKIREDVIMAETYTLKVAGLTRELAICKANEHLDIAAFIMLGDTELTVACATELLKKCPEFDCLLTAEAKGIPVAHEISRQSGKPYLCARKSTKLYMKDPVIVEDESITTVGKQKLVLDRTELDRMNGKRVLLLDDVISTGGSLHALEQLAARSTCTIVGRAAVLAEGDAANRTDIIYLEKLPLFVH
jgi:adenine phosphoribosyltransferase